MINYKARDVMRKAVTVDCGRTVAHGKLLMDRTKTDCLYVIGKEVSNGLFYKTDVTDDNLKKIIADFAEPCRVSVVSESDLSYVLSLFEEEQLYSLLVMEQGKCTGIITRDYLIEDGFIQ